MKDFSSKVLATILAAGIVANVAIWKQFGERLARIETKLDMQAGSKTLASK